VSRSLQLLRGGQSIELFLAPCVLLVTVVATGAVLFGNGAVWFTASPRKAVEQIYHSTIFGDARDAAKIIAADTQPGARIAVLGSEPEICFYAQRRSAAGHIYAYPLMELHPYAAKMQEDMIAQIEKAAPEYVVFVNNPLSWLVQAESEKKILDWWPRYWEQHYTLVQTITTQLRGTELVAKPPVSIDNSGNFLLILRRKEVSVK